MNSFENYLELNLLISKVLQLNYLCYAMLRKGRERESKNIKERRKIHAAGEFSDKYEYVFAIFKNPIKFIKLFIKFLKRLN